MEAITNSAKDYLIDGLSFKLKPGAILALMLIHRLVVLSC